MRKLEKGAAYRGQCPYGIHDATEDHGADDQPDRSQHPIHPSGREKFIERLIVRGDRSINGDGVHDSLVSSLKIQFRTPGNRDQDVRLKENGKDTSQQRADQKSDQGLRFSNDQKNHSSRNQE